MGATDLSEPPAPLTWSTANTRRHGSHAHFPPTPFPPRPPRRAQHDTEHSCRALLPLRTLEQPWLSPSQCQTKPLDQQDPRGAAIIWQLPRSSQLGGSPSGFLPLCSSCKKDQAHAVPSVQKVKSHSVLRAELTSLAAQQPCPGLPMWVSSFDVCLPRPPGTHFSL